MNKYMNKLTAGILAAVAALGMMIPTMASAGVVPSPVTGSAAPVPVTSSVVPSVPVTSSVVPSVPVTSSVVPSVPVTSSVVPSVPVTSSVVPSVPVTESALPVTGSTSNSIFHNTIPVDLTFSGIDGTVLSETIRIYGKTYQNSRRGYRLGKEELLVEVTSCENKTCSSLLAANVDLDSVRIEYDYSRRYYRPPFNKVVWLEDCVKDTDDLLSLTVGMYSVDGMVSAPDAVMAGYVMCQYDYIDARGIYQIDNSVVYVTND